MAEIVVVVGIAGVPTISTGKNGRQRNWHDIATFDFDIAIGGVGPIGLGLIGGHEGRGSGTERRLVHFQSRHIENVAIGSCCLSVVDE